VISSYTPTLRALRQARQATTSASATGAGPRLLVVAVPDALGEVQLVNVEREVERLRARFGTGCTVLSGPRATPDQVLAALADHQWVHFSCHGRQDLDDPSQAGLGLADHTTLTVTDLSARQQVGDFAFLAACQTATGGLHLPDEVITLAAAMHFTGFRHVVATLWSVSDEIAANVVEEVYERLGRSARFDADEAACAVHDAVRTVRAPRPLALSEWLPFTHTGP
jgi:CHAT domain-containing protein